MELFMPTFTIPEAEWTSDSLPTERLRFVDRGGKMVLQQLWVVDWGNDTTGAEGAAYRWLDIPVEAETDVPMIQGEE